MSILIRMKRRLGIVQVPKVGDRVWWAPKGIGAYVTSRDLNGNFVFQGGPIVENRNSRQVPRWTVMAAFDAAIWHPEINAWVVGQGPIPKGPNEVIITPIPVSLSGQVKGGFHNG